MAARIGRRRGSRDDASVPTLAGSLASRGYATGGFVANTWYCNAAFGLDRGFARGLRPQSTLDGLRGRRLVVAGPPRTAGLAAYVGLCDPVEGVGDKPACARDGRCGLAWIDGVKDRPFFASLNYFDAHATYLLPEGVPHRKFGLLPATPEEQKLLRGWHDGDKKNVTPRQAKLALDGYNECLAFLDQHVGRLVDELERRGRLRNTVVVITSDHGEEFGEHGLYGHGRSLYSQELHVPLIVFGPGVPAGRRVERPVDLRDLAATSVELLGQGGDLVEFPGHSLSGVWSDAPMPSAPILSEDRAPGEDEEGEESAAGVARADVVGAGGRPELHPTGRRRGGGLRHRRRSDRLGEDLASARVALGIAGGPAHGPRVVAGEDGAIVPQTATRAGSSGAVRR